MCTFFAECPRNNSRNSEENSKPCRSKYSRATTVHFRCICGGRSGTIPICVHFWPGSTSNRGKLFPLHYLIPYNIQFSPWAFLENTCTTCLLKQIQAYVWVLHIFYNLYIVGSLSNGGESNDLCGADKIEQLHNRFEVLYIRRNYSARSCKLAHNSIAANNDLHQHSEDSIVWIRQQHVFHAQRSIHAFRL